MKPVYLFLFVVSFSFSLSTLAQENLPKISVSSFNGKVVVSWLNDYEKPITDIFIQRSFDSVRNFSTIGSVLIPQNKENGYPDNAPPYDHMYYRVSIVFQGGGYVVGPSCKPSRVIENLAPIDITDTLQKKSFGKIIGLEWDVTKKTIQKEKIDSAITLKPDKIIVSKPVIVENMLNNTSSLVYSNRFNQLSVSIPDSGSHTYQMKILDDRDHPVFELNNIKPEEFVIEKYNFRKSGTYSFEIYEDGKLWRKNKFVINKDSRK